MRKTAKYGVSCMAGAAVLGFIFGSPNWAIVWALIAFYVWGMVLAHIVCNARMEADMPNNLLLLVSEAEEIGYMGWFWLSWLTYFILRPRWGHAVG